jgi:nitrate reductase gamma subunit
MMTPSRRWRWGAWAALAVAWAVALLVPVDAAAETIGPEAAFTIAKSLHAGVYAVLTLFGGTLPATRRGLWLVLALLSLHAMGGELGQWLTEEWFHRHGQWSDVALDHAGIAVGVAAGWHWWRRLVRGPVTCPRSGSSART